MSEALKFRILFISRAYGERAGGMERLSWELIQELRRSANLDVRILANHTKGGGSMVSSRTRSVIFAITVILRALFASKDVDIVHIGDPVLSIVGWLIKKLRHKKIAVTVHGLDIVYSNILYQLYLIAFFKEFDLYVSISDFVNGLVQSRNVRGKTIVIHPGLYDRFYDPTIKRNALLNLLSTQFHLVGGIGGCIKPEYCFLLTSGRLVKRKGHEWFVRTVLPNLPGNVVHLIAGDGPEISSIQEAAKESGVLKKVFMLGRVSSDQLKILYNTVDAFVQPNIKVRDDIEGFGLVLLEASSCGRPIYASRLEGIQDAIQEGKNGMLLEAGNSQQWIAELRRLASVPPERRVDRFGSRQYVLSMFDWRVSAQKYIDAFKSLLNPVSR